MQRRGEMFPTPSHETQAPFATSNICQFQRTAHCVLVSRIKRLSETPSIALHIRWIDCSEISRRLCANRKKYFLSAMKLTRCNSYHPGIVIRSRVIKSYICILESLIKERVGLYAGLCKWATTTAALKGNIINAIAQIKPNLCDGKI